MHDEDNDGRFPDQSPVEVRYPRSKQEEQGDRERWPWLPGTIVEQCGPDEWYVCIEVRELAVLRDGRSAPRGTASRNLYYPCRFRDSSEIRPRPASSGPAARLLPLSVDGLILAASLVLLHEARNDRDAPRLARFMLWLGIAATIGANISYGAGYGLLGVLISAWPAVAFIGSALMRGARGYLGEAWSVATGMGAGRFGGRVPSLRIALVKRAKILRSGTVTTVNRFGSTEMVALTAVESVSCGRSETVKSADTSGSTRYLALTSKSRSDTSVMEKCRAASSASQDLCSTSSLVPGTIRV